MHAVEPLHSPTPEELMEYVDGEGAPARRDAIAAHLAACSTCQALVASQRELSDTTRAWTVDAAPASLRAPEARPASARLLPFGWRWQSRAAMVTFSAVAAGLVLFTMNARPLKRAAGLDAAPVDAISSAQPAPFPDGPAGRAGASRGAVGGVVGGVPSAPPAFAKRAIAESAAQAPRTPSIIRTATLRIVVKEFGPVRENVESLVAGANGFIDQLTVSGDTTTARLLRGTLRVPADRLADVLARLRALGAVTEDTQGSQDVTDQIVDLDARLASARATEKRLTELLAQRTGRLSDVLDVERELARVRLDIERLDAEKTNVTRRVTYATIDVTVAEERKASLDGPLSLGTRVRLAALDGIDNVVESAAGALLFILRAGPALVFWVLLAAASWAIFRRTTRRHPKGA